MTEEEREAFYDAEVAPKLLELGKACQANGLSFVASVEWAPNESGRTANICEGSGAGIRMVNLAAQCQGNIDSFIWAMMRYAREHGHTSACLSILGVPMATPTRRADR